MLDRRELLDLSDQSDLKAPRVIQARRVMLEMLDPSGRLGLQELPVLSDLLGRRD